MQLFYCERIEDQLAYLSASEAQHVTRVLRHKPGDELGLIDGKGGHYLGRIIEIGKGRCVLEVLSSQFQERRSNYQLQIAIAPTKNIDRLEWFLEKATEIGIDRITPILCQRSERKRIRLDRLNKIVLSAVKQSKQLFLPQLDDITSFPDLITQADSPNRFIAWCGDDIPQHLSQVLAPEQDCLVLIGPEGDFSPEEVELAKRHDFQEVSLGPNRLRTETAGVVAVHTVAMVNLS